MAYLFAALLGYLLGCSNMALYLSKWKQIDFRSKGSGNLGASNAAVLMGWRAGIAVGIHDIGKAILTVCLAKYLFPHTDHIGAVAGVSCVLGHIFPFYLKFKGGKGFAAYLGMTIALNWKFALVVMVLIALFTWITDYIVSGTMTTILLTPLYLGIVQRSIVLAAILLVATGVIIVKHLENFKRIRNGTEIGLRNTAKGKNKVS